MWKEVVSSPYLLGGHEKNYDKPQSVCGDYGEINRTGCDAVYSGRILSTFGRKVLFPFSE
jgi:hypothetical protein